jgi:hypothetical protein
MIIKQNLLTLYIKKLTTKNGLEQIYKTQSIRYYRTQPRNRLKNLADPQKNRRMGKCNKSKRNKFRVKFLKHEWWDIDCSEANN